MFVTAMSVIRSGDHPSTGSLNMCVCASISPGNTVARTQINDARSGRNLHLCFGTDFDDSLTVDHHDLVGQHAASLAVEQAPGTHHRHAGGRRALGKSAARAHARPHARATPRLGSQLARLGGRRCLRVEYGRQQRIRLGSRPKRPR
jgi:hypothetical protein